ncbi:hypothetical protein MTR_8g042630 [Medicago truncatula]|uniref:Uncharacterized protein n=1 Tax=Medicago truncatula TaxID=3880 RepID=A0A072TQR3_MEDTR|nr:hypothetical protein MTR_8g042630 [Medicago truncatula]
MSGTSTNDNTFIISHHNTTTPLITLYQTCCISIKLIETTKRSFLSANTNSPASGLIQLPNSSRIPINEEFLLLTPRTTIEELKNVNKGTSFIVFGISIFN